MKDDGDVDKPANVSQTDANAEWSLSQLKMFDDILVAIELDKAFTPERVKELVNLLNTCRLRKYSTKPAEWSEEDEKKINFLARLIEFQVKDDEYCFGDGRLISKQEAIEMLKSLRPYKQE